MTSFPVRSARELMDAEFDARWTEREAIGEHARATLAAVLDHFVVHGGRVAIPALAVEDLDAAEVRRAVNELDRADCLATRDDHVVLAYPFASTPTGFVARLADGAERHACCAIDALGIAAMLGQTIVVRARCHHCAEPLELTVDPTGPRDHAPAMAWVGRRDALRAKACDGL